MQVSSGRFVCFACGAWGYLEEARERWQATQQRQAALRRPPARQPRLGRLGGTDSNGSGGLGGTVITVVLVKTV